MDFKKKSVRTTVRPRNGLTVGIVEYNNGIFKVNVKDKLYNVNGFDFKNRTTVYSLPNNDKLPNWTIYSANVKPSNYHIVGRYWATIKDKQKLKGNIIDNRFDIVKYR